MKCLILSYTEYGLQINSIKKYKKMEKKRKNQIYDESYRLEVVRDYYESGESKGFIMRKWHLSCRGILKYWLEKYPISSETLSLSEDVKLVHMKKNTTGSLTKEDLLAIRIKELEKALEMEKLRSRAYEIMIDITEREEGICIRKKAGAKR